MEQPFVDIHSHVENPLSVTPRMTGIHPWSAAEYDIRDVAELAVLLGEDVVCAEIVGETGLDALCGVDIARQERLFRLHLALAVKLQKPVVIHSVRMVDRCLKIVGEYSVKSVVFHGFIGSAEQAAAAVAKGCYISFGRRAFRSPKSIAAMRQIPIERLFLESDEGQMPIAEVYGRAAEILDLSIEELKSRMMQNMKQFFGR